MIAALLVTSCSFELFAETNNDNENGEVPETVLENPDGETPAAEEPVVEEPADPPKEDGEQQKEPEKAPAASEKKGAPTRGSEDGGEDPVAITEVIFATPAVTANSVSLSWTYNEGASVPEGETITVKYSVNGVEKGEFSTAESSWKVNGLDPNTTYTFVAYYKDAEVGNVSATTKVDTVKNVQALSSYNKVYLSWSKVSGASYYVVNWTSKNDGKGKSGKLTSPKYTHKVSKIYDLYNTSKGLVGDEKGGDRFNYTITAYDSNGKVLAKATKKGDVVKTLYYKLTFKGAATLTSHSGGKVKIKIKKGQVIYARGFTNGKYIFDYKCSDGKIRTFHTMKIRVKASLSKHIAASKKNRGKSSRTYTAKEAELYVNDRGITSQTKYLIWANLFTQKEYVFYSKSKGKKKDWKLVKAKISGKNKLMSQLPISSGKASMPTATGATKINRKLKSQHGTPLWNVTKYFSVHGVQKKWPKPGWPESGACVRNQNPNATWIYKNVPQYSRVFVH